MLAVNPPVLDVEPHLLQLQPGQAGFAGCRHRALIESPGLGCILGGDDGAAAGGTHKFSQELLRLAKTVHLPPHSIQGSGQGS